MLDDLTMKLVIVHGCLDLETVNDWLNRWGFQHPERIEILGIKYSEGE